MSDKLNPFFILGNPRSGTSLFRLMLNRHSEIVVPPECGYLLWYYQKYKNTKFSDDWELRRFSSDVVKAKKFETWGVGLNEIETYLLSERPDSFAEACACVHRLYAISKGKVPKIWGDKNNYYISEAERLFEIYEEAKFLFLVRDPRDVFASYVDLGNLKTNSRYAPRLTVSPVEFADEWTNNLNTMDALAGRLSRDNYLYVRYEDVVSDPNKSLTEVLAVLGVDFEQRVLAPDGSENFIEREPVATLDWKKLTQEAPDLSRLGRFKKILSHGQISEIEDRCVGALVRFGYLER